MVVVAPLPPPPSPPPRLTAATGARSCWPSSFPGASPGGCWSSPSPRSCPEPCATEGGDGEEGESCYQQLSAKWSSSLGAVTSLWSFLFSALSSSSTFSELSADALYLETWPSSLLIWMAERKTVGLDGKTWLWRFFFKVQCVNFGLICYFRLVNAQYSANYHFTKSVLLQYNKTYLLYYHLNNSKCIYVCIYVAQLRVGYWCLLLSSEGGRRAKDAKI